MFSMMRLVQFCYSIALLGGVCLYLLPNNNEAQGQPVRTLPGRQGTMVPAGQSGGGPLACPAA